MGNKLNKDDATLMSYIPGLKVLDCTLRDGGLINNFNFSDEFARELYKANIKAGVDYMEFGYKASTDVFDEDKFGKWKFCKEEDIRAIVGENDSKLKISVMLDVGRTDYEKDLLPRSESVIDMVRIATYIHQIPTAVLMARDAKNKGYEVCMNIMAVSKVNDDLLNEALEMIGNSCVDVIYFVDSFGSFYPEQIETYVKKYMEIAKKHGLEVGFHGHNNQQLAFANTITALRHGATLLDATMSGMGRGAGNCYMELLLAFLKNPKYKVINTMDFVEKYITKLKDEGCVWGYDFSYLMTGILNSHPRTAIKFVEEKRTDYKRFYNEILDLD